MFPELPRNTLITGWVQPLLDCSVNSVQAAVSIGSGLKGVGRAYHHKVSLLRTVPAQSQAHIPCNWSHSGVRNKELSVVAVFDRESISFAKNN